MKKHIMPAPIAIAPCALAPGLPPGHMDAPCIVYGGAAVTRPCRRLTRP